MVKKTARQIFEEDPPIGENEPSWRWHDHMRKYINMVAEETKGMTPTEYFQYFERIDNQNKQEI